jgi:PAS domain S-box-containing protein
MTDPIDLPFPFREYPVPTWLYDKTSLAVIAANNAAIENFGLSISSEGNNPRIPDFLQANIAVDDEKPFTGLLFAKDLQRYKVKASFKAIAFNGGKWHLLIVHDFQKEQKVEEGLEAKHSRLDKIVHVSHNEIYLVADTSLKFEYANTAALRNLGYSADDLKNLQLTDLFNFPDEMALHVLLNTLRKSETDRLQLQLKFTRKNGTHYDADVLIQVLEKDKLFLVIVTDITDKLITEKNLLHTIREKETLIKEIHHRVKNNLQLISSIIYLKLATLTQSDIRNFLEDTRQKIRSIALIHERLLQTEKLDKVEISDYLGKLIHDLNVTYHRQDLTLSFETQIEQRMINLDSAIICGLIVNELVTNAMKHAFAGRSTGSIAIEFRKNEGNKFLLSVADNGVSLPEHIVPGSSSSFGMQLIDVFVKQLGGTFEIIRGKGTKFQISF